MIQNCMFGAIRWQENLHPPRHDAQQFDNGLLQLSVQRLPTFDFDDQAWWYDADVGVVCGMVGYVANLEDIRQRHRILQTQDAAVVGQLYTLKGISGLTECDGLFYIVIFDAHTRTGYLWQSEYGMTLPLYYAVLPDGLAFSTSLKQLLRRTALPRVLNREALQEFLIFEHVIPHEITLLQGVNKLTPKTYLRIDCAKQTCTVEAYTFKTPTGSKAEAKAELLPSIETNIRHLAAHLRRAEPVTTLTAGWDTNLMLWALRNQMSQTITAVTIDGGQAYNEVPTTQQILRHYQQITHITSTVETTIIDALPDIVWMTEGAVFENGMFLRYALGKVFAQHGITAVFLGACADQVMYPVTLLKRIGQRIPDIPVKGRIISTVQSAKDRLLKQERWQERDLRKRITGLTSSVYSAHLAYHLDIEFLLKMHGLLFNGFGVHGLFPFLNRRTAALAQALGMENRQKRVYKAQIRKRLAPTVTQHFQKSGAVVDTRALVAANQTMLLKVFTTDLIRSFLPAEAITQILRQPDAYYKLILQCAYLYLFQKLILSGQFDEQFDQPRIAIATGHFLGEEVL